MSIVREADMAFRRWRQSHPDEPLPPVAVYLAQLDRPLWFEGFAVAPTESHACFALTGFGGDKKVVVVRDADVERVEINKLRPEPLGFQPSLGRTV